MDRAKATLPSSPRGLPGGSKQREHAAKSSKGKSGERAERRGGNNYIKKTDDTVNKKVGSPELQEPAMN